ncbi:MAG: hypothetical protein HRT74_10670, partial [Flavobacteriales bacterium]|nr:hypothetical protein [Flavobacteriales bacterium]
MALQEVLDEEIEYSDLEGQEASKSLRFVNFFIDLFIFRAVFLFIPFVLIGLYMS